MKKNLIALFFIILVCSGSFTANSQNRHSQKAKYVFLFIGDGMGTGQVASAETWLAAQKGIIGSEPLSFTNFPVLGISTTYSANSYITCSSAAGTALSTGYKTNNHMLGVDPDTNKLTSITYKIHNKGIPVGILSTVTIDHATPGSFYANSTSRNDYYSIAAQIPSTGFEFFGGGGFIEPTGKKNDQKDAYKLLEEGGYSVVRGLSNLESCRNSKKIALFQEKGKDGELPFAIDRKPGDLTLKELVSAAVDHLYCKKGFFIMAEGGKIDWAAHSNDAKSDILEVLDFADAIDIAYQFYLKHPDETLIVVTSDHDTGGMSMGRGKGSKLDLMSLDSQKSSFAVYNSNSLTHDENEVEAYQKFSEKAYIGWTTTSHLGNPVLVFSIGAGSTYFSGRMDNTEIPRKIMKSMNIEF